MAIVCCNKCGKSGVSGNFAKITICGREFQLCHDCGIDYMQRRERVAQEFINEMTNDPLNFKPDCE